MTARAKVASAAGAASGADVASGGDVAPATRGRSFDAWAEEYDRYRPGYPAKLFRLIAERLGLPARPEVADLGSGTGRAALAMARLGWSVRAVEPGEPMLAVLRARAQGEGLSVSTRIGRAESTGLQAASVDLVTAAQAFHWFDAQAALSEMARILRAGGGVALFWNVRDEARSPVVAAYHRLLDRYTDDAGDRYLQAGRPGGRNPTRAALAASREFGEPELLTVRHEVAMRPADFIGMTFTASYVRALAPDRQAEFREAVLGVLAAHGVTGEEPFPVPYRVDLWVARRSAR